MPSSSTRLARPSRKMLSRVAARLQLRIDGPRAHLRSFIVIDSVCPGWLRQRRLGLSNAMDGACDHLACFSRAEALFPFVARISAAGLNALVVMPVQKIRWDDPSTGSAGGTGLLERARCLWRCLSCVVARKRLSSFPRPPTFRRPEHKAGLPMSRCRRREPRGASNHRRRSCAHPGPASRRVNRAWLC